MAVPLAWYKILTKVDRRETDFGSETELAITSDKDKWVKLRRTERVCFAGLDHLRGIDQIIVSRRFGEIKGIKAADAEKRFLVRNINGDNIYFACEDSNFCDKIVCGRLRPYRISLFDHEEHEIIRIFRPCAFFLEKMEVSAPPGELIGYIKQTFNMLCPKYVVKNEHGVILARVECPANKFGMARRKVIFKVFTKTGMQQVGLIAKKCGKCKANAKQDLDVFGMGFPLDMDNKLKGLLLAAGFLIEMLYY